MIQGVARRFKCICCIGRHYGRREAIRYPNRECARNMDEGEAVGIEEHVSPRTAPREFRPGLPWTYGLPEQIQEPLPETARILFGRRWRYGFGLDGRGVVLRCLCVVRRW